MFSLTRVMNFYGRIRYSLSFQPLTISVLSLSFGLSLAFTHTASAFEFDKKLLAPDGARDDSF